MVFKGIDYIEAMKIERQNYEHLDFSKQVEIISEAPLREKADLILRSQRPEEIIPSLSCEDFFLILHATGSEMQPELLVHATGEQLVFIGDFDCWHKDEIEQTGFLTLMDKLNQLSEEQLKNWLVSADFELLIACFIKGVEVIKTEHLEMIDDYIGDRPFFTLDNLYYICIEGENYDVLRRSIEILYESNKTMYMQLLEAIISESEVEITEEAFTLRNQRLAEYGFPEKDEAMRVFLPIQSWSEIEEKQGEFLDQEIKKTTFPLSTYPALIDDKTLFLDQVMSVYQEKMNSDENVYIELLWLANKIIVCEEMDFRESEALLESLEKARKVVSIALEDLSHGKINDAVEILKHHWIENLHRWGVTRLHRLKQFSEELFLESRFTEKFLFMRFLGSPLNYHFKGLQLFQPMKSAADPDSAVKEYEEFESLAEVESVYRELMEIKEVLRYLSTFFKGNLESIFKEYFTTLNFEGSNLNLISLLATGLVRIYLKGEMSFDPLSEQEVRPFLETAFDNQKPLRRLTRETKEKLLTSTKAMASLNADSVLLKTVFSRIEEEMGGLKPDSPLSLQYIPVLLTLKG